MKHLKILLLLLPTVLPLGCSQWFNASDAARPAPLVTFKAERHLQPLWRQHVAEPRSPAGKQFTPTLVKNALYTVDASGRLSAVNARTGQRLWQRNTRVPLATGAAYANGRLFVVTQRGELQAYQAKDGQALWSRPCQAEVLAKPVTDGTRVFVKSQDGQVFAFAQASGEALWHYNHDTTRLILQASSVPVVYAGQLLAGFPDGEMVALSANTGRKLWQVRIASPRGTSPVERMVDIAADPVVGSNTVFVMSYQGNVAALKGRTGQLLWRVPVSGYAGLTLSPKRLFLTNTQGEIFALKRHTGKIYWRQNALHQRLQAPPHWLASGSLVVADTLGYVHVLHADDGHFQARERVDALGIKTDVVVRNDLIYVYGLTGDLTAYRLTR